MVYTRPALSLTTQQDREGESLLFAFAETMECKDVGHFRGSQYLAELRSGFWASVAEYLPSVGKTWDLNSTPGGKT